MSAYAMEVSRADRLQREKSALRDENDALKKQLSDLFDSITSSRIDMNGVMMVVGRMLGKDEP